MRKKKTTNKNLISNETRFVAAMESIANSLDRMAASAARRTQMAQEIRVDNQMMIDRALGLATKLGMPVPIDPRVARAHPKKRK